MSVDDFSDDSPFHGSSYSYDYDETPAAKPSSLLLIGALVAVLLGGTWALLGALQTAGFIGGFEAAKWWGVVTYGLTLLVPSGLVIYLRRFHYKHSMPAEDGEFANYDSHATQQVATNMRKVALLGVFFSLFAIFIFVWPLAQEWA